MRPQLYDLNTEVFVNQGLWCTLMVVLKRAHTVFCEAAGKIDNRFGLSEKHKKHWAPRQHYTQAASIESVSLRWLVDGALGPLWRGTRLEEVSQIDLKSALVMMLSGQWRTQKISDGGASFVTIVRRHKSTLGEVPKARPF